MLRGLFRAASAVTIVLAAQAVGLPFAHADVSTLRATSLQMGQTNGTVWAVQYAAGRVYVGGSFTSVRPAGSPAGSNEVAQSYLAAFDSQTGAFIPSFSHQLTNTYNGNPGVVRAMALSPDGSTLYVGGDFNAVDGISEQYIAAFDTSTGALIPGFGATGVNAPVYAIAATSSAIYVGGTFTKSSWRVRPKAAAFTPSGSTLPFAPQIANSANTGQPVEVNAVAVSPDEGTVYLGGTFDTVDGVSEHALAAVNASDGGLSPTWSTPTIPTTSFVTVLRSDGSQLYVAARDDRGGAGRFEGVKALTYDGQVNWFDACYGDTFAVLPLNGALYVATHAHDCSAIGGWPESNPRHYASIYAVSTQTGGLLPFNPDIEGSSSVPGSLDFPRALTTDGSQLFVGGGWLTVNGQPQANLARFGPNGPGMPPDKPWASAAIDSTGHVVVRWKTVSDLDDRQLTYSVYRTWHTTDPLFTRTIDSTFWNPTGVSFTDTGATPGVSTYYRVSVSDGINTVWSVNTNSVTPPVTATPVTPYPNAVLQDRPTFYWRLNDGTSNTAADATGQGHTGSYNGGMVRGIPGPLTSTPSTAVTLPGTTSLIVQNKQYFDPTAFTLEFWFRTASTQGGRIMGFSSAATGTSSTTDRQVYLTNTGRLVFGVSFEGPQTIETTGAYNDNQWHYVVASQDSTGLNLYVDGSPVGQLPGVTDALGYWGYWRVGGDKLTGWPDQPTSNEIAGSVGEVAVYPVALTPQEVAEHYAAR